MSIKKWCSGASFAVITFFSMGAVVGILSYLVYFLYNINIRETKSNLFTFSCVGLVVSFLFFVVCTILPVFNIRCLKMMTSYLYLIFDIFLITTVVLQFYFRARVHSLFDPIFDKDAKLFPCKFLFKENGCGINESDIYCEASIGQKQNTRSCKDAFQEKINHRIYIIACTFIANIVILSIGIVIAFYLSCQTYSDSELGVRLTDERVTSLMFGW